MQQCNKGGRVNNNADSTHAPLGGGGGKEEGEAWQWHDGRDGVKFPKGGDKIHLFLKDKGGAGNPSLANNPKAMTKRRDNQPRETGGADRAASLAVS